MAEITKLKKKAWNIFSRYIRTRDCLLSSNSTEFGKCFTCDKIYPIKQLQAGHFVDSRTKPVLFNEDIVHSQCARCNIYRKGAKDDYTPKMISIWGTDKVLEFLELRHNKDKTWRKQELEEVIELCNQKLKELML